MKNITNQCTKTDKNFFNGQRKVEKLKIKSRKNKTTTNKPIDNFKFYRKKIPIQN